MNRPAAKGWCPGAHRPMVSGDGLIVRVRPRLGRLTVDAARGLCAAAQAHGSGVLEFTRRANIQIRGVRRESHAALLDALDLLGLLDPDPAMEARRNILAAPLWRDGDATQRLASRIAGRLSDLPELPAKFGFAVDCGPTRALAEAPADIRIERGRSGGLILRADGLPTGRPVTEARAVEHALLLARWFAETGGAAVGRMARLLAVIGPPEIAAPLEAPVAAAPPLSPGPTPLGPAIGAAFGQAMAGELDAALAASRATHLRLTPWRLAILESGEAAAAPGFLEAPHDALLAVDACPGAPSCAAASVETRPLARALAGRTGGARLHVSGCAKSCARSAPAAFTLCGREGRFDLIRNGSAWDAPDETGLSADTLRARFGAC